jgi:hypothetical protein
MNKSILIFVLSALFFTGGNVEAKLLAKKLDFILKTDDTLIKEGDYKLVGECTAEVTVLYNTSYYDKTEEVDVVVEKLDDETYRLTTDKKLRVGTPAPVLGKNRKCSVRLKGLELTQKQIGLRVEQDVFLSKTRKSIDSKDLKELFRESRLKMLLIFEADQIANRNDITVSSKIESNTKIAKINERIESTTIEDIKETLIYRNNIEWTPSTVFKIKVKKEDLSIRPANFKYWYVPHCCFSTTSTEFKISNRDGEIVVDSLTKYAAKLDSEISEYKEKFYFDKLEDISLLTQNPARNHRAARLYSLDQYDVIHAETLEQLTYNTEESNLYLKKYIHAYEYRRSSNADVNFFFNWAISVDSFQEDAREWDRFHKVDMRILSNN